MPMLALWARVDRERVVKGLVYPKCFSLFSGGKDSSTATDVLAKAGRLEAVCAFKTKLATPDWEQHVEKTCEERKWRLEWYETTESYEGLVMKYGYPGPGKHSMFMSYLKGRCVRQFKKRHPTGILASGVRSDESVKRAGSTKPFGQWEGAPILAPIHDWTTEETWAYFRGEGFERAPAYSTLQISGDCLCGAYAREDERSALEFHYPAIGKYFRELGEAVKAKFPKRWEWGWGWKQEIKKPKNDGERMVCVECAPRDLFPETVSVP